MTLSYQKFAHAMAAEMSLHAHNCNLIGSSKWIVSLFELGAHGPFIKWVPALTHSTIHIFWVESAQ